MAHGAPSATAPVRAAPHRGETIVKASSLDKHGRTPRLSEQTRVGGAGELVVRDQGGLGPESSSAHTSSACPTLEESREEVRGHSQRKGEEHSMRELSVRSETDSS